ncbi:transposable element Tc1 transposase [Trichonephila clavipes]|uniref:Transposable element Tc1 transposase n=1 Tax=Trichonephila clavipes TaxID=2585209 RepID=A0A8X6SBF6_TRICX|nr:transposable element Tc1 transposase [Trichonephila clavipes]
MIYETKQLKCGSVIAGCRWKRRTDGADDTHLIATLPCGSRSHITNNSTTDSVYHSVTARTIRCRLPQSGKYAWCPLLRLSLTGNYRRLSRPWRDERWTWTTEWNDIVFTDESRFCLQHHDDQI